MRRFEVVLELVEKDSDNPEILDHLFELWIGGGATPTAAGHHHSKYTFILRVEKYTVI